MKLIYRGTTYERNPSQVPCRPFQQVRAAGPSDNLTYRGVNYCVEPNTKPAAVPALSASYKLSYRGMTYFVN